MQGLLNQAGGARRGGQEETPPLARSTTEPGIFADGHPDLPCMLAFACQYVYYQLYNSVRAYMVAAVV